MNNLTLRSKLIIAFLAVALAPLGILGLLNERAIQKELTEDANLRLSANAMQTAAALSQFIDDNLNAVRSQAKLPVFSDFLLLPPVARAGNPLASQAASALRALSLKDFVNISSYALLDLNGNNLIDTDGADIGQNMSSRDYVNQPLLNGLPYVSTIKFPADPFGEIGLYFSAPVRDVKGSIAGVLAVRYRAALLQRLVANHNGLAGDGSFAILLDENHLRLAHGTRPELLFKLTVPMAKGRIDALQSDMRLPLRDAADLSTSDPILEKGLANAAAKPHFSAPIGPRGEQNFAAVTGLQKLPWLVVYTQPRDTFLAPIRAFRGNILAIGFVMTLLVVVVAMVMANLLAGPIIRLTDVAKRISVGDLSARARPEASDEIGSLAETFNHMTTTLEQRIAERDRSKQEADSNRKLLADAVEALPDGFVIFDDEDRLYLCNRNYRDIYAPYSRKWKTGTSLEQIARDTAESGIGIRDPEQIEKFVRDRLERNLDSLDWNEQRLKDDRWIRVGESRLANGWAVGTRTDITRLKRVEADLHASEARFRDYAKTAADYFWDTDADLKFSHIAGRYQQITGIAPEDVIGLEREDLLDAGLVTLTERSKPLMAIEKREVFANGELRWHSPDGAICTVSINGKPKFDEQGTFLGYRGTGRDITAQIRAQQDRERLIDELENKNAELEKFDYTISHELKSPLVTITGFAGLLLQDIASCRNGQLADHARRITEAAETMSLLLDELLEMSRIGRVVNSPESIDFGDLTREVVASMDLTSTGRDLEIDIAPDLPVVYGDRMRMREVIQNLVANAIKFSHGKTGTRITIGHRSRDGQDVFYVEDNGEGIDPAYHDKIFGLFERLNPTVDGTGIGLALVQRILREHGGRIWVESDGIGKGSTFCFTLKSVRAN